MSEQTLMETLSALVEQCAANEAGKQMITAHNQGIQFTVLDSGDLFYLEAKDGQAQVIEGEMPARSLDDGYEIKGDTTVFREWFNGQARMSDLIEDGRLFPVASHTTKRHIDYWLAQIIRIGNGLKIPKEVY